MARQAIEPDRRSFAGRVGYLIKSRRVALGLAAEEAAAAAGASRPQWYRWEQGNSLPAIDRLPEIARALQCSPKDLIPEK